jgi:hypothetical protein
MSELGIFCNGFENREFYISGHFGPERKERLDELASGVSLQRISCSPYCG